MEEDSPSLPMFVIDRLSRGIPVIDSRFDELFPIECRSPRYWTPVHVALMASAWFIEAGCKRVLDIGAGVGKFCVVGAIHTRLHFVGVEQRANLVKVAQAVSKLLQVDERVTFIHASFESVDVSTFDGYYLYNPFGENLYSTAERIASDVELNEERFKRDTLRVEQIFRNAPIGTAIVTYHGFGGRMPNSFAPQRLQQIGSGVMRLWIKRRSKATGCYVETDYGGLRLMADDEPEGDNPFVSRR
jgi:Methyltransferase domain